MVRASPPPPHLPGVTGPTLMGISGTAASRRHSVALPSPVTDQYFRFWTQSDGCMESVCGPGWRCW